MESSVDIDAGGVPEVCRGDALRQQHEEVVLCRKGLLRRCGSAGQTFAGAFIAPGGLYLLLSPRESWRWGLRWGASAQASSGASAPEDAQRCENVLGLNLGYAVPQFLVAGAVFCPEAGIWGGEDGAPLAAPVLLLKLALRWAVGETKLWGLSSFCLGSHPPKAMLY